MGLPKLCARRSASTQMDPFETLPVECDPPAASWRDAVLLCTHHFAASRLHCVHKPLPRSQTRFRVLHCMEAGRKRGIGLLSTEEPAQHTPQQYQTASVSTSGSVSTSLGSPALNQLGSPGLQPAKQQKQHQGEQQQAAGQSFPVLEYHMQQQGAFLNNTLQPADSSTWSNWQQLPTAAQLELLNQGSGDQHMADSQPQLARANSAPELVKLTQADSAAWQQAHTPGGGSSSGGVLSQRNFWMI